MKPSSVRLRLPIVMLLFFTLCLTLFASPSTEREETGEEYAAIPNDTNRVLLLFKTGNQFIDGPSDSLLFYYGKALNLIHDKLSLLGQNPDENSEMIQKYRAYELRVYIEFGIEYFFQSDYSQALDYYFRALHIAESLGDRELISECNSEIGIVYKNQGKYDSALLYSEKALDDARLLNDSSWTAVCYANLGTVYLKKGYFSLALNNYLDALKTFEALDQKRRMGACYLNVGRIYSGQNDFKHALGYYSQALENAKLTGNKMNLADTYLSMGEVWLLQYRPLKARAYLDSALLTLTESGYSNGRDDCFTCLGHTYKMEGQYDKAKEYYQKALQLSTREDDLPGMAESCNNLAEIEYKRTKLRAALVLANQSLVYAGRSQNLERLKSAWEMQSKINEALGNETEALAAFKIYSAYKDTLFNESKYRSIREAEAKFETEKKEQKLALLTEKNEVQQLKLDRRNNLLITFGTGILLVLFIAYLLIRQNRIKSKQKAILLEQRLLRSQMNPHFIFNSLIAIQSYIYKKEPVLAGDYLAKFADLVRFTLDHSRVEFVPLSDELKMLTAYLDLQVLRFENKFEYTLSTDDEPDINTVEVPPMFAQPFVENAIEHGLRYKKEKGQLTVSYALLNSCCIEISITDDGVGREEAGRIEKKKQHRSLSVEITKERLLVLSRKHKRKFEFEVTDLKDSSGIAAGTKVKITLPLHSI